MCNLYILAVQIIVIIITHTNVSISSLALTVRCLTEYSESSEQSEGCLFIYNCYRMPLLRFVADRRRK